MQLAGFFSTAGMDSHPGEYFFGLPHLIYFLLNVVMFILLWNIMKKRSLKTQNTMISVFFVIMLVMKYAGDALFIYEYYNVSPPLSSYPHAFWDVDTFFSFQLCGITNILLPIVIWFDIKPLKEFVVASSILGGMAVIIYPVTVLYGDAFVLTLPKIRSITVHFFLLLIPLFLIHRGDVKLDIKRFWQTAIGLVAVILWASFGNYVIDVGDNNLYLMNNPFLGGPVPVLNALPDGWHIIAWFLTVSGGYFLTYKFASLFEPGKFKSLFKRKKKLSEGS